MQQPPATPPGSTPPAALGASTSPVVNTSPTADDSSSDPASVPATTKLSSSSFPFGQLPMSPGFLSMETLNAVSQFADDEEDGFAHHKINQYTIKSMIGRGSYGAVHIATDQYGKEFAVKEFSKARLRKRARSNLMKQGPFRAGRFPPGPGGLGGPLGPAARFKNEDQAEAKDALYLIREEIAIMKKLNHPNLVELIEVLDDPEQDSLYMVLEMCKKGVIMDVGLGKTATPYNMEQCRYWFRDLMLGIEYLHAQNIIHRDIKPDNLLITDDDVLKIGDFGVSEIFEKAEGMRTSKTAGSPAFFPPELCVPNHGGVDGPSCDIWSMGITLYCLRYGKIPFEHDTMVEIYDAINNEEAKLPDDEEETFVNLMRRILDKDPSTRITMGEMREHPWVTMSGADPLLSKEENCANPIEPPNALELNHAFTQKMGHLLCVLKAIQKFKGLLHSRNRDADRNLQHSFASDVADLGSQMSSVRVASDNGLTTADEVARLVEERRNNIRKASLQTGMLLDAAEELGGVGDGVSTNVQGGDFGGRESGSGIDADRPTLLLGIGTGGGDDFGAVDLRQEPEGIVSESPTAVEFDVYDRAFQSEVERIRSQGSNPTVYLTKVLERKAGNTTIQHRLLARPPSTPGSTTSEAGGSPAMADIVARIMKESKEPQTS
ncbi:hypothetical protein SEUCBS139899_003973 [Sporothrix eucalyptigena]|uniref:Protein kinase domain-containing protein n=1 Tax=Sporothrix eucalyptigena TaxID=1812306 RepID=A0ABP0AKR0_9PEZI